MTRPVPGRSAQHRVEMRAPVRSSRCRAPGRLVSPESRYDGIGSPGRTTPNSDDMIASHRVARLARRPRRAWPGRGRRTGPRCRSGPRGRRRLAQQRVARPGGAPGSDRGRALRRRVRDRSRTGPRARPAGRRGRWSAREVKGVEPSGLPRRGADLPSDGGSRISTRRSQVGSRVAAHRVGREQSGTARRQLRRPAGRRASARSSRSRSCRPSSRPRWSPLRSSGRGSPRLPELDRTDLAVRHHRPGRLDGPGPGDAPGARRRRLRRALRDRRRRRLRRARRRRSTWRPVAAARRCTAPTPRSRCTRRCSPRARPRCCPDQVRPAFLWTHQARRGRRPGRREGRAGAGAVDRQARLRGRAEADRRRQADPMLLLLKEIGELRDAPARPSAGE